MASLARALVRTRATLQPSPALRTPGSLLVLRSPPPPPPPRAAVRRWLSDGPPTPPKTDKKPLTRKQVDTAKANADSQEKVWNMLVPERNMTWKSPLFWVVLCGVCYLHYYNGREAEKEEVKKAELAAMAKANTEKRRAAPLSAAERAEQIAFKQRQVVVWEAKRASAQREVSSSGSSSSNGSNAGANPDAAALARLKHAEARLEAVRAALEELQQTVTAQAEPSTGPALAP